jgi:hypothetical protein
MSDEDDDQEVGYGKPPIKHQWKRGQSGNPKGRPPKPKALDDAVKQVLEAEMIVTENGKKCRITGVQALVKTLMHGALKGDAAMMRMLLRLAEGMKSPLPGFEPLPEDDEILKQLLDQLEQKNDEQDDHEDH